MNSFYRKEFNRWVKDGEGKAFLTFREEGLKQFLSRSFPTTRQEEWRFTNVSYLKKSRFTWTSYENVDDSEIQSIIEKYKINNTVTLCMINGVYHESYSSVNEIQNSIVIHDILSVDNYKWLQSEIDTPFVHWNSGFFQPGLYLEIKENAVIDKPIHILWINRTTTGSEVVHSKAIVNMGLNSEATVIDHFIPGAGQNSMVNHVSNYYLNENSQCEYIKIQEESHAMHFHSSQVKQDVHSRYKSTQLALGSVMNRNDCAVIQDGEGCDSNFYVLALQHDRHHIDYQTTIRHDKGYGTSREVVKNILRDSAHAVFNGRVIVSKGSQKTDARQSNKNILLSKDAHVNANPQLEIYADDVACSHGSTTGELDDDALFYLRSRGINREAAQALMISGFASEVIENITNENIRNEFNQRLNNWLAEGE